MDPVAERINKQRAVILAARALLAELELLNVSSRIALTEREALRSALAALDNFGA